MAITYRIVKGTPLTFSELDGNFTDLDGRLDTVESDITTIQGDITNLQTNKLDTSTYNSFLIKYNAFTASVITTGSANAYQSITGSLAISGSNLTFLGLVTSSTATNVLLLNSSGQVYYTASSALGGGSTPSGIKTGNRANSDFQGTPRSASVSFGTSFSDTNYAITVTGNDARSWTIQNKGVAGFVINSNSNVALTSEVYWMAMAYSNP